jgi:hypothetical protein
VTDGVGVGVERAVGAGDEAQPDNAKPVSSRPERIVNPVLAQGTSSARIEPTFF